MADLLDILKIQIQRTCQEMPECVKPVAGPKWKREIHVVVSAHLSRCCTSHALTCGLLGGGQRRKRTFGNVANEKVFHNIKKPKNSGLLIHLLTSPCVKHTVW